jgi:hypothetical protein
MAVRKTVTDAVKNAAAGKDGGKKQGAIDHLKDKMMTPFGILATIAIVLLGYHLLFHKKD